MKKRHLQSDSIRPKKTHSKNKRHKKKEKIWQSNSYPVSSIFSKDFVRISHTSEQLRRIFYYSADLEADKLNGDAKNAYMMQNCEDEELNRFAQNIVRAGLGIRNDPPKDGSCFFHAVNDQLQRVGSSKTTLSSSDLRSLCVKYLYHNPTLPNGTRLSAFTECKDWSSYLNQMEQGHTWVDDIMVLAMSSVLYRRIVIITSAKDTGLKPKTTKDKQTFFNMSPCVVIDPIQQILPNPALVHSRPLLLGLLHYHYLSLCPMKNSVYHPNAEPNYDQPAPCSGYIQKPTREVFKYKKRGKRGRKGRRKKLGRKSSKFPFSLIKTFSLEKLRKNKKGKKVLFKLTDRQSKVRRKRIKRSKRERKRLRKVRRKSKRKKVKKKKKNRRKFKRYF